VLEVGAGDSPSPRSDILVDFALEARERQGGRIRRDDRPLVLARGEALPFRDKAFDYAIACPRAQRASGAVPRRTAARRLCRLHRNPKLVVGTRAAILLSSRGSHRLHRRRRSDAGDTQEAGAGRRSAARTGLRRRVQPRRLRRSIRTRGFTRFHWKDRIRFSVVNPEVASAWPIETARADDFNPRTRVRRVLIAAAAGLFAVRRRLRAARRSRSKPPPRGR